jgi:tRNA(Arg) A34 adenosine deaminase TadA
VRHYGKIAGLRVGNPPTVSFPPPYRFQLELPVWLRRESEAAASRPFTDAAARMAFVTGLARRNVEEATGGPFGAAVFTRDAGGLVACGVNLVVAARCAAMHAEIVALTLAQQAVGGWNLSAHGPRFVLACTVEPCAMCLGALPWSGISALECGARDEDARKTGFDEGDKSADWAARLAKRGITVTRDVGRMEARAVLEEYQRRGGLIYQPHLTK